MTYPIRQERLVTVWTTSDGAEHLTAKAAKAAEAAILRQKLRDCIANQLASSMPRIMMEDLLDALLTQFDITPKE